MRSTLAVAIAAVLLLLPFNRAAAQQTETVIQVLVVGEGLSLVLEYDKTQGDIYTPAYIEGIKTSFTTWVNDTLDLQRLHDAVHIKEVEKKILENAQAYLQGSATVRSVRLIHDCKVLCNKKEK